MTICRDYRATHFRAHSRDYHFCHAPADLTRFIAAAGSMRAVDAARKKRAAAGPFIYRLFHTFFPRLISPRHDFPLLDMSRAHDIPVDDVTTAFSPTRHATAHDA